MSENSTIAPQPTRARHDARHRYTAEHAIRIGRSLSLLMPNVQVQEASRALSRSSPGTKGWVSLATPSSADMVQAAAVGMALVPQPVAPLNRWLLLLEYPCQLMRSALPQMPFHLFVVLWRLHPRELFFRPWLAFDAVTRMHKPFLPTP